MNASVCVQQMVGENRPCLKRNRSGGAGGRSAHFATIADGENIRTFPVLSSFSSFFAFFASSRCIFAKSASFSSLIGSLEVDSEFLHTYFLL